VYKLPFSDDLSFEHIAQNMLQAEMDILSLAEVMGAEGDGTVNKGAETTAAECGKADGDSAAVTGIFNGLEDIGRTAGATDGDNDITRLHLTDKLLNENILITNIIADSSHERDIIRKAGHTEARLAGDRGPLAEITDHMRGCGSAAAIAKYKDLFASQVGLIYDIRNTGDILFLYFIQAPAKSADVVPEDELHLSIAGRGNQRLARTFIDIYHGWYLQ
jgi:hypothetical protein